MWSLRSLYDVTARTSTPEASALVSQRNPGNCAAFACALTYLSRQLAAPRMLDSVLLMATLSSRLVAVAVVARILGFPRLAWSVPPPSCSAFLSIPLSQRTTRECDKRTLPTTPPRSCSVSEATERRTRTHMMSTHSDRRTRGARAVIDDRDATGIGELATLDKHTVTSADVFVWPESDSPAHSQELPVPIQTQPVDADATAAAAAATAAAVAAVAVVISLAPLDAAAATTTTTNIQLAAQASAAPLDIGAILTKAGKASFGGGASGAAAAVVQVLSLMWLRTTMNFQVSLP